MLEPQGILGSLFLQVADPANHTVLDRILNHYVKAFPIHLLQRTCYLESAYWAKVFTLARKILEQNVEGGYGGEITRCMHLVRLLEPQAPTLDPTTTYSTGWLSSPPLPCR
ncbi:hypothetical protein TKK_0012270 [Trichogramma kaykai]